MEPLEIGPYENVRLEPGQIDAANRAHNLERVQKIGVVVAPILFFASFILIALALVGVVTPIAGLAIFGGVLATGFIVMAVRCCQRSIEEEYNLQRKPKPVTSDSSSNDAPMSAEEMGSGRQPNAHQRTERKDNDDPAYNSEDDLEEF